MARVHGVEALADFEDEDAEDQGAHQHVERDAELALRRAANPVVEPSAPRGYRKLYLQTVTQAGEGVDFDFLRAAQMRGTVPSPRKSRNV